jgi:hypothetical protein
MSVKFRKFFAGDHFGLPVAVVGKIFRQFANQYARVPTIDVAAELQVSIYVST